MNAAMTHRGPDDVGTYLDGAAGVGLGARRLSIIDIEGGHQPLGNENGSIWAALNGEIYNHPALIERLEGRGHRFSSRTDTEVLVHLYEDYGDALVHALEGMYAFALWDSRRRRMVVARDRFGEKPLFYTVRDGELTFASELTALLAGVDQPGELRPEAVDDFFVFGYVPGPGTMIEGVYQLPPAHLLLWEGGSAELRVERYWSTPEVEVGSETFDELKRETRRLLEQSVASRMIADVPLGVLLSGGVDSTLIAALAARRSMRPVKTFTVGYDLGNVSEADEAQRTAARLGTEHHEIVLEAPALARRAPDVLAALDQPLADQALVAAHAVAERAREEVTVVVGGEGADELFGGYPRYRWLERAERMAGVVPRPLAATGAATLGRLPTRARRLADVLKPAPALERHLDWVTEGRRHLRPWLYGPRLAGVAANGRLMAALAHHAGSPAEGGLARHFMRLDQTHWLPDDVLIKADRASMLVSLEVRTPFLQREVAELAASVPTATHLRGGGKALLRAILSDLLPPDDRSRRPKTAFRVPAAEWLSGPLAPLLRGQLARGAVFEEGWLDRAAAGRLVEEHCAGRADRSSILWPMLALGLWLDRHRGRDVG